MAEHDGAKKEVDPDEILRRKFRMKCAFRALGRMVMANAYWLMETSYSYYEGVENVKLRVEQAVRGKEKTTQLLGLNDKALLNKPADDRTEKEKKYLYRIIGGLKCFRRYPNLVKRKLAAVTYFKYYGPGRTIVRQHQEAHALYFIVTGEVVVSQMFLDELLQQYVSVDVGVMHPGDMFGEVSLLHNIPRTATVTTTSHCELLALMKEDFKNVLQASVQKQWDEVKRAMSAFTYFDTLDEVARREGCIVAKLKRYNSNETILGDGVGVPNYVYFVLSGKCQMIESLQIIVTERLGHNYYSLHDPRVSKEESKEDLEAKYFGDPGSKNRWAHNVDTPTTSMVKNTGRDSSNDMETEGRRQEKLTSSVKTGSKHIGLSNAASHKLEASESQEYENFNLKDFLSPAEREQIHDVPSPRLSVPNTLQRGTRHFRTYFMQVCRFNPGSSFGFGENMRDRRIVALTPVSCLLLPLVWLLQRNTASIWTRIKYFLEKKIPTKKQLFEEFVDSQRWTEYRKQLVADAVARSNTVNTTSIHDVPYSIRMEEIVD